MSTPKSLVSTKKDGIMSFGPWFTGGHIETGGADSITHVPVGKKIMLIATRGRASRRVEALVKSSKSIIDLLSKPPAPQWKQSVEYYISDPTSLMIQPALCAHAVITLSKGPALAVGFEEIVKSDDKRRQQVLSYYSSGVDQNKSQVWLDVAPDKTVLGKIKDVLVGLLRSKSIWNVYSTTKDPTVTKRIEMACECQNEFKRCCF